MDEQQEEPASRRQLGRFGPTAALAYDGGLNTVLIVSITAFAATLLSGLAALYLRGRKAAVFAFCAGALIGSAVIVLLPNSRQLLDESTSALDANLVWLVCAIGYVGFYLFERGSRSTGSTRLAGLSGAIGLAAHSFFDGVVIGQGFRAGEEIGFALALAVLLHKLADGVSAVGVMLGTEHTVRETIGMLVITAVAPVLGAIAQSFVVLPTSLLALMLSGFAGMFLYLAANRLLPEARETGTRAVVAGFLLVGIAVPYLAHSLN